MGGGSAGIAPERGEYSRIGACPYLLPRSINSHCCPCKGRISLAGLAPQLDARYEPLTGARFISRPQEVGASPYPKYEPLSGALAPQFDVGPDGVTTNLTNCCAGRLCGIAPERGSYSRIGACPYLPPQLINSHCCPCKGRISLAGLAPQQDSRYEPLTGARFINRTQEVGASPYPKYEPLSGALAPQVRDIRAALRGLKAQQVRSPGQRPGLTYVPHLRPVRAKVINNRLPILLPLQAGCSKFQKN